MLVFPFVTYTSNIIIIEHVYFGSYNDHMLHILLFPDNTTIQKNGPKSMRGNYNQLISYFLNLLSSFKNILMQDKQCFVLCIFYFCCVCTT